MLLKQHFSTDDCSESRTARDFSFSGSVHMPVTAIFLLFQGSILLGTLLFWLPKIAILVDLSFVTRYNVHCMHSRFFEFVWKKLGFGVYGWVWGSRRCACQRTDTMHLPSIKFCKNMGFPILVLRIVFNRICKFLQAMKEELILLQEAPMRLYYNKK